MLQSQDSNGIGMEMFSMRGIEVLTTKEWQNQIKEDIKDGFNKEVE
jgi:hypothetical protein